MSRALLLIDVQQGLEDPAWGRWNNPGADGRIAELLATFRQRGLPVVHIRHDSTEASSSLRPGQPGHAFKPYAEPRPGEWIVPKHGVCAFAGTDLEARLRRDGIDTLILAGFSTPFAVGCTARWAGDLGFRVLVAEDACAAFTHGGMEPETLHAAELAVLAKEFATPLTTFQLLEMLP